MIIFVIIVLAAIALLIIAPLASVYHRKLNGELVGVNYFTTTNNPFFQVVTIFLTIIFLITGLVWLIILAGEEATGQLYLPGLCLAASLLCFLRFRYYRRNYQVLDYDGITVYAGRKKKLISYSEVRYLFYRGFSLVLFDQYYQSLFTVSGSTIGVLRIRQLMIDRGVTNMPWVTMKEKSNHTTAGTRVGKWTLFLVTGLFYLLSAFLIFGYFAFTPLTEERYYANGKVAEIVERDYEIIFYLEGQEEAYQVNNVRIEVFDLLHFRPYRGEVEIIYDQVFTTHRNGVQVEGRKVLGLIGSSTVFLNLDHAVQAEENNRMAILIVAIALFALTSVPIIIYVVVKQKGKKKKYALRNTNRW